MRLTRDSLIWPLSIIGALAVGISTRFDLVPWLSPEWRRGVELVALIYGIFAAKMGNSPLPGKCDAPQP